MTEYSISPAGKILGYLFAAACILGGMYMLYSVAHGASQNSNTALLVFGILLMPMGVWVYLGVKRTCVNVDDQLLKVQTTFGNDEVLLSDIEGYRRGEKDSFLLVRKDGGKSLTIPQNISGRKDLIEWIETRYEDVDARELEAETEVLLEDERYGGSREERESALAKAQTVGKVATGVGFGLMIWMLVYPNPYPLVMWLAVAAPGIAVYLTWSYKGLLRLNKVKKSPYPTAVFMMLLPTFGLGIRALFYDLYGFPGIAWGMLIGVTVVLTFVAVNALRPAIAIEANKNLIIGFIVLIVGFYSYGLLLFSNCYYDPSRAQIYAVQVTGKHASHGKTTTYYLELSPWGKYTNGTEATVSSSFYNRIGPQDSVLVLLNQGRWGIPWYRVTDAQ